MDGLGSSIQHFLFSIPKPVVLWIEFPLVLSVLLLSWGEVSVSLSVLRGVFVSLRLTSSVRVEKLLGVDDSLGGHSELHLTVLGLSGPVIASFVALAQRFADVRGVLAFFDVVELVLHATQVLSLDNIVNMLGTVSAFSITESLWLDERVFGYTVVSLDLAWLVDMRLSELL